MSTTTKPRPRRRHKDPGPELPMPAGKKKWEPSIFRRKLRSNRLYARFEDAGGKRVVRSTGCKTETAAKEWLTLKLRTIEMARSMKARP